MRLLIRVLKSLSKGRKDRHALVPKRVTVRRGGRTFTQTVWVRPNIEINRKLGVSLQDQRTEDVTVRRAESFVQMLRRAAGKEEFGNVSDALETAADAVEEHLEDLRTDGSLSRADISDEALWRIAEIAAGPLPSWWMLQERDQI